MKTKFAAFRLLRVLKLSALLFPIGMSTSCMTTYDANGRPMQTVDPGLAVAGIAAAGLIGYAAADNHHHNDYYYGGRGYYGGGGGYHHGGYYRGRY
ncbi:MAG: hypothetical protein ABI600_07260 [Luteolibacter sp.]